MLGKIQVIFFCCIVQFNLFCDHAKVRMPQIGVHSNVFKIMSQHMCGSRFSKECILATCGDQCFMCVQATSLLNYL